MKLSKVLRRVGDIVAHIASASSEQSAGIEQVNQAVSQMDDITQQNAALAEQAAAGSIAMSEQSTNMTQLLSFFRVNSKGGSAVTRPVVSNKAPAMPVRAAAKKPAAQVSKPKNDSSDEWEEF